MSSRFRPSAYPPHWPALRQAVLVRAAYACECQGECGSGHGPTGRCHAPQYAHVVRELGAPWRWWAVGPDGPSVPGTVIRIVLAPVPTSPVCGRIANAVICAMIMPSSGARVGGSSVRCSNAPGNYGCGPPEARGVGNVVAACGTGLRPCPSRPPHAVG